MPVQTIKKGHIFFPDGAKVSVKREGEGWFDIGAINSSITATLNWNESTVDTANAGKLATRISNMEISGGFTLINLDPVGVAKLGGGVFEVESTPGTAVTTGLEVQSLGNVVTGKLYELRPTLTSGHTLTPHTSPTCTIAAGSTPLTSGTDYDIVALDNVYYVSFASNESDVKVTYSSVTPVASTTVYAGTSTYMLESYAMKIEHTDGNNKVRKLELYSVYGGSGSFQFNFKGANEDGVEEMPLTFTARLDTRLTDGKQLMAWTIEDGAE